MKTLRFFAASTIVLFIVFGIWYAKTRVTNWHDWHEWASMALLCFAVLNSCLLYKAAK